MGRVFAARSEAKEHAPQEGETLASILAEVGEQAPTWQELALFNWATDDPRKLNRALAETIGIDTPQDDPSQTPLKPACGPKTPGKILVPKVWQAESLEAGACVALALAAPPLPALRLRVKVVRAAAPEQGKAVPCHVKLEGPAPQAEQATDPETGEVLFMLPQPGTYTAVLRFEEEHDGFYRPPEEPLTAEVNEPWQEPLLAALRPGSVLKARAKQAGTETWLNDVTVKLNREPVPEARTAGEAPALLKGLEPGTAKVSLTIPGDTPVDLADVEEVELLPYAATVWDKELRPPRFVSDYEAENSLFRIPGAGTRNYAFRNDGDLPLQIVSVVKTCGGNGQQTAAVGPLNPVPGGQASHITFTGNYNADDPKPRLAIFTITTNDPDKQTVPARTTSLGAGAERAWQIIQQLWAQQPAAGLVNAAATQTAVPGAVTGALQHTDAEMRALMCSQASIVPTGGDTDHWASGGTHVYQANGPITAFFRGLFDDTQAVNPAIEISKHDLFHGHVFFCPPDGPTGPAGGDLGILFHAKEYPTDGDDAGKAGDPGFAMGSAEYQDRNILYLLSRGRMWGLRANTAQGGSALNQPMLLQWVTYQQMAALGFAGGMHNPVTVNAIDNGHFYEAGVRLPDVNVLLRDLDGGPQTTFYKAYQAV